MGMESTVCHDPSFQDGIADFMEVFVAFYCYPRYKTPDNIKYFFSYSRYVYNHVQDKPIATM